MIETYTDVLGRTQYAVTGPNGDYLVTRKNERSTWEVRRSDSLHTTAREATLDRALKRAKRVAGVTD